MNRSLLIPVSEHVVTKRINNALKKEGKRLVKSRSDGEILNMGDWYVIETCRNQVVDFYCRIEEIARDRGVLQPYECITAGQESVG